MTNIKNEFASLCWGLSKKDNEWSFYWELLESYKNTDHYTIFTNKITKLIELLNKDESILEKDIETEIYDVL